MISRNKKPRFLKNINKRMDVNLPLEPPVNNNLQASLYDRIDAITFEKIRVANSQLNSRLEIQEKILNKYRKEAEKIHDNQYRTVRREFRKIHNKKPDYIDDFEIGRTKQDSESKLSRVRSLSETSESSYCRRYYSHHFHIKDQSKKKEEIKKPVEKDYFNARLRCFFLNMVNYAYNGPDTRSVLEHNHNFFSETGSDIDEKSDVLQESTNTLHDLNEEVFKSPVASRQSEDESRISNNECRSGSKLNKLSDIPIRPAVVNALKTGLENICNTHETVKRPTAGLRLESISPRPKMKMRFTHGQEKPRKHRKRSRLPDETDEGMLGRSADTNQLKTGALQTDLNGYSDG